MNLNTFLTLLNQGNFSTGRSNVFFLNILPSQRPVVSPMPKYLATNCKWANKKKSTGNYLVGMDCFRTHINSKIEDFFLGSKILDMIYIAKHPVG